MEILKILDGFEFHMEFQIIAIIWEVHSKYIFVLSHAGNSNE